MCSLGSLVLYCNDSVRFFLGNTNKVCLAEGLPADARVQCQGQLETNAADLWLSSHHNIVYNHKDRLKPCKIIKIDKQY